MFRTNFMCTLTDGQNPARNRLTFIRPARFKHNYAKSMNESLPKSVIYLIGSPRAYIYQQSRSQTELLSWVSIRLQSSKNCCGMVTQGTNALLFSVMLHINNTDITEIIISTPISISILYLLSRYTLIMNFAGFAAHFSQKCHWHVSDWRNDMIRLSSFAGTMMYYYLLLIKMLYSPDHQWFSQYFGKHLNDICLFLFALSKTYSQWVGLDGFL